MTAVDSVTPEPGTDEPFRRLHPLTPVLRGWKVFAGAVAIAAQQAYSDVVGTWLLVLVLASIPAGVLIGLLSWWTTHYRVGREDLRVESGLLFRRSRRIRLDRLQAVDVVRPLVARLLGLAELRLEVAGGSSAEAPLAYLSEAQAQQLRAELLARAAGIETEQGAPAPEAPERPLAHVPLGRLIEAQLRTGTVIFAVLVGVSLAVASIVLRAWEPILASVPFFLATLPATINGVIGHFDFTLAESPDGLRIRRGLLETRAQTVPPGRVQALRLTQPLLWRSRGWQRVEVTVAGYAGEGQEQASVLLPVAGHAEVAHVLSRILPGLDLAGIAPAGVPRRARWLDPLGWRFLSLAHDERVVVIRRGRWRRQLDVVPLAKAQSMAMLQGVIQRRLGLVTLVVHTTPGPVAAVAAHRDAAEGRALLDDLVRLAPLGRTHSAPDRWMIPRTPAAPPTVTPVTPAPADLDFADPALLDDPYPALARLREQAPVVWHEPTGQWLALTFEHCNQVLRDRRLGRLWHDREPADIFEPFNLLHRNQMMENEPPVHTRLRALVAKAFARGHVERLRPRVAALAEELLDRVDPAGFDVIHDFAEPLPVAVIAELLGVPEADRGLLRPWSQAIVAMYEYRRSPGAGSAAVAAAADFAAYMRELADERRRTPREDLVSHLVAAEESGQRLTGDELVASAILLLNAGHEASVNGFGNGLVALLRRPDQLAALRAGLDDPALVESAVEEMLRFDSPLQLFERTAKEDVEVDGVVVPAGQRIAALLGAANRDPAAFAGADTLDLTRRPNNHIAFGAGLHHCLGAPLARMELQTSLPALLRRFPALELAGQPERRPTFVLRGYLTLPVRSGR